MTTTPTAPGRKSAVTPESLHAAALELINAGQPVTGARIRAVIGSGSMTTINDLLRQWRNEHQAQVMPAGGVTSISEAIEQDDTLLPAAAKAGIAKIAAALNDALPALARGIAEAVAAERHVSRLAALDTEARLAAAEEDLSHTSAEAEALQTESLELRSELAAARNDRKTLESLAEQLAQQITSQSAELETQRQQIASQTAELEAQRQQIASQTAELETQRQQFARQSAEIKTQRQQIASLKQMLADQEMLEKMLRDDLTAWKAKADATALTLPAAKSTKPKRPTKAKQLDLETTINQTSKVAGTDTPT